LIPHPALSRREREEKDLPEGEGRNGSPGKIGRKARGVPQGERENPEAFLERSQVFHHRPARELPALPPVPSGRTPCFSTIAFAESPSLLFPLPLGEALTFPPSPSGRG